MEVTLEKCKRKHRKSINFFDDVVHVTSESSLSSSESQLHFLRPFSKKSHQRKSSTEKNHQKRDYLTRLLQKKRLKEKSLSKKMKTPFDRKINRTCWPIELGKVSRIKKKPTEKRKKKPTQRSLRRKKFSSPTFMTKAMKMRESLPCGCSELSVDEDRPTHYEKRKNYYYCGSVTPEVLVDVLRDPEYINTGATIDMIVEKLRAYMF